MRVILATVVALACMVCLSGCFLSNNSTDPTDENNIRLVIHEDGGGREIARINLREEGTVLISPSNNDPYMDPPHYFIYATREDFYTHLYFCEQGDVIDIDLTEVDPDKFCGVLFIENGYFADEPVKNTEITVKDETGPIHTFMTDEYGRFAIDISTGDYVIEFWYPAPGSEEHKYEEPFSVSGSYSDYYSMSNIPVEKPNIYVYPLETMHLSITLSFPNGGHLTSSDPDYGDGWHVVVEPSGVIDGSYDYLFYESRNPDFCQYDVGWVVACGDLQTFFENNMTDAGFSEKEVDDFLEYWVPLLTKYPHYAIYPQYAEDMAQMIKICCSPEPDNSFRLVYAIRGIHSNTVNLLEPVTRAARREGFFIMEWGVILR